MNKYITDTIRNNSRSIVNNLSKPQKECVHEMIRGLMIGSSPILRHLAQNEYTSVKKQAEKYSHHLGNIKLKKVVDNFSIHKAQTEIKKHTIIAYDLTDANKEFSKKIEYISKVFDGSQRKVANGFLIHGVGMNNMLLKFEMHNTHTSTKNQTRKSIIEKISEKFNKKGIWVMDRGNDDKAFFKFLHHKVKVKFICRLKENRTVVIKETGVIIQVKNLSPGKYKIYLMNRYNTKVDTRKVFTLVIKKHLKNRTPIRLITNLSFFQFSEKRLVEMYLERWGVENIFRRAKTKFDLEKIRVLKYQKFQNLVSLIQFVINVSTIVFKSIQKTTNMLIAAVLLAYKHFVKLKSLTINSDSFISYIQSSLNNLFRRKIPQNNQLSLFSRRTLVKLGSF